MIVKKCEYAVYKGDELLGIGNVDQLAKMLNKSPKTIYFWSSPSQRKRNKPGKELVAINIDKDALED